MKDRYLKALIKTSLIILITLFLNIGIKIDSKASTFDPAYYSARYPDVAEAFGTDTVALYNHYLNNGISEGRFANATEEANASAGIVSTKGIVSGEPALLTYVDVDIENQIMTYYQDGQVMLQTSIVTGNVSKGRSTPTGVYSVYGKVQGKYLTGPTWKNWVDYWMPFTKSGCGLHDATWRSSFGGTIYQTAGSHGCVNLPHDVAAQLYSMVSIGTVVVVH